MLKWFLAFIILFIACSCAHAQDPITKTFFVGPRYAETGKISASFGYGTQINGGLWTINHGNIGEYNNLQSGFAYGFQITDKFWAGPILGPGVDWESTDEDPIAYITGAAGFALGYWLTTNIGIGGGAQYSFALDNDAVYYRDGYDVGLGLIVGL